MTCYQQDFLIATFLYKKVESLGFRVCVLLAGYNMCFELRRKRSAYFGGKVNNSCIKFSASLSVPMFKHFRIIPFTVVLLDRMEL